MQNSEAMPACQPISDYEYIVDHLVSILTTSQFKLYLLLERWLMNRSGRLKMAFMVHRFRLSEATIRRCIYGTDTDQGLVEKGLLAVGPATNGGRHFTLIGLPERVDETSESEDLLPESTTPETPQNEGGRQNDTPAPIYHASANVGLSGLDSKKLLKPERSKPKQTHRTLTLDEFELVASTGFRFAGRQGFFGEIRAAGMDQEQALELAKQARWMEDEGKTTKGAGALLRAAIRGGWDYIFGYTPAEAEQKDRYEHIPTDPAALHEGLREAGKEITPDTGLGKIVAWMVETWDAYDQRRDYDYEALRPRALAVQRLRLVEAA